MLGTGLAWNTFRLPQNNASHSPKKQKLTFFIAKLVWPPLIALQSQEYLLDMRL